jgi:hypothetical protein
LKLVVRVFGCQKLIWGWAFGLGLISEREIGGCFGKIEQETGYQLLKRRSYWLIKELIWKDKMPIEKEE